MALLDGSLDEALDVSVGLEEAILELAGLLTANPQDTRQTLAAYT